RPADEPVVRSTLIIGLVDAGACAQTGAAEDLLPTLLPLHAERSVRAREQSAVRASHRRAGIDPVIEGLLQLGVVASGELDGLIDCQCGSGTRVARHTLGGCLHGTCCEAYEKQ